MHLGPAAEWNFPPGDAPCSLAFESLEKTYRRKERRERGKEGGRKKRREEGRKRGKEGGREKEKKKQRKLTFQPSKFVFHITVCPCNVFWHPHIITTPQSQWEKLSQGMGLFAF